MFSPKKIKYLNLKLKLLTKFKTINRLTFLWLLLFFFFLFLCFSKTTNLIFKLCFVLVYITFFVWLNSYTWIFIVNFSKFTHKGRFNANTLNTFLVKITTTVSRDYACLMSPDGIVRRLSRMRLLLVVRLSSLFVIDGGKHLNFVDDGWNKYWLNVFQISKNR